MTFSRLSFPDTSPAKQAGRQAGPLTTRLSQVASLQPHERRLLHKVERKPGKPFPPGSLLARGGEPFDTPLNIASGWVGLTRELSDGRRQLLGILLPGDFAGLQTRQQPIALVDLVALTLVHVVDASEVEAAWREGQEFPALAFALELCAAEEEAILLDQIVRLGRQSATERMAHLFLEWEYRLSTRGLAHGGAFEMPLTQEILGDALGLSLVHVNRTIQQLRRLGLIDLAKGRLTLLNRRILAAIAEFHDCALSAGKAGLVAGHSRSVI